MSPQSKKIIFLRIDTGNDVTCILQDEHAGYINIITCSALLSSTVLQFSFDRSKFRSAHEQSRFRQKDHLPGQ